MNHSYGKRNRTERRLSIMRSALTRATDKFTAGGHERFEPPKPISLPKLRCLEGPDDEGRK